jgi:outer membrane receptor protein involved in Fe transport
MNSNSWSRPASLVTAAVALVLGHAAYAETVLGEITVTARKRAESVQDVPFAISARSGEQLRDAGATNIEDISRNVAGFSVQNLGPGQSQIAMRGVSAGQTARDLPGVKEQVGVYIDESVISLSLFTPDLELYDLNRIEVLRGPQGTLFGSGSLSGTVRYISNQPDLSASYGDVEVTGNAIDGGDSGGNVSGMFNMPMGNTAALRIVGYYSDIPGFIEAVSSKPHVLNRDVNGGTRYGVRAAMRFEPNENLAITPRVIYQKVDMDGFNRTDAWNILGNPYTTTEPRVTLGDRDQYTQLQEQFKDEFMLADLTVEAGIGDYKLTSITSYTDRDILVLRDATQLTGSVTYDLGGTGNQVRIDSPLYDATKLKAFTQELRIASDYEGSVQWLAGAFYSDIQRDYGQTLPTPGYDALMINLLCGGPPDCGVSSAALGSPTDTPFYSRIPYDFTQKAVFAEVNFGMGERANLAVGARYYDFKEDRVLYFGGLFADSDGLPTEPTNGPGSAKSSDILPRVLFSYDVNENVQLNAQVSEGFRLGGINDPLNLGLCDDTDEETYGGYGSFKDENLWNYELGAKIGFADGRAQFNVSVFDAEIDGLQVPVTAGTCSSRIILNVKKSHSQGVEMEFVAQPTDHFDFGFSATLVNSELDSTFTALVGSVPTIIGGIEKGNRMASVPEFQMAANATYKWQLTDQLEGYVTGSFQHIGDRYTQVADQVSGYGTFNIRGYGSPTISSVTFDPLLPEYDIGNIRFGVRGDDWEAGLFINNLSDESAKLGLDRERGRVARVGFLTNQPRTFGLTYRRSFGGAK